MDLKKIVGTSCIKISAGIWQSFLRCPWYRHTQTHQMQIPQKQSCCFSLHVCLVFSSSKMICSILIYASNLRRKKNFNGLDSRGNNIFISIMCEIYWVLLSNYLSSIPIKVSSHELISHIITYYSWWSVPIFHSLFDVWFFSQINFILP